MGADDPGTQVFEFDFEPRYRWAARPFGIVGHSYIELTGEEFVARFGPWCVRTPRANIASCALSGPYGFVKTAGPAHLSLADRGLTFATNSRQGLCVEFSTPVRGIDPLGLIRHPNLTVTPADPAGLARTLEAR
ncbi:hypothetical protein [Flexivirga sp.]|uniref:hypothetical protein n=1 Tax=Flexivirga sp. TaxID=1962927 RepID=UPI003F80D102